MIRVLTAKAVQKVLMQMGPVDGFTAKWLNSYCADHPPLEGNAVGDACINSTLHVLIRAHQCSVVEQRPSTARIGPYFMPLIPDFILGCVMSVNWEVPASFYEDYPWKWSGIYEASSRFK